MASLELVVFMVRAPSADFWYALPHHHIGWPNIHLGCLLDRISCYSCMFLLYPSLCHRICHFTSILIFRLVFKENWNNTTIVNALFADGRWVGYPFMCFFYWDLKMMVLLKGLRTCCYCCDIVCILYACKIWENIIIMFSTFGKFGWCSNYKGDYWIFGINETFRPRLLGRIRLD